MSASESAGPAFGANSWLVEEMYEQYRADPDSVGESWREFFEDYRSMTAAAHPELAQPARRRRPSAEPAPAASGAGTPELRRSRHRSPPGTRRRAAPAAVQATPAS